MSMSMCGMVGISKESSPFRNEKHRSHLISSSHRVIIQRTAASNGTRRPPIPRKVANQRGKMHVCDSFVEKLALVLDLIVLPLPSQPLPNHCNHLLFLLIHVPDRSTPSTPVCVAASAEVFLGQSACIPTPPDSSLSFFLIHLSSLNCAQATTRLARSSPPASSHG